MAATGRTRRRRSATRAAVSGPATGLFRAPLSSRRQGRAALVSALVAVLGYQAAQMSLGFPPTWRATLAPTLWLVPFWAAGLCVMFAASTLTIERPQHARWHQGIAAVVVAAALLAVFARGGIGDPAGILAYLTQARLPRALGASAFVFATLLGGFVNPLLPGRALIWAALLTFSAVWFKADGLTHLLTGGAAGGAQRAAGLYLIGLAAGWAPLLVWTSFKTRRDDE